MAVDTRDKRASVLGWGLASLLVLPAPGVIDQPDRQHVAYSYRGILAGSPVVAVIRLLNVDGSYVPDIHVAGAPASAVNLDGSWHPAINVDGTMEQP